MTKFDLFDLWVCTDCHLSHHGYETEPDTAPWSAVEGEGTVTDNTTCSECFEAGDDCEHNTDNFRWSWCDGCDSTLGGSRYLYVLWVAL